MLIHFLVGAAIGLASAVSAAGSDHGLSLETHIGTLQDDVLLTPPNDAECEPVHAAELFGVADRLNGMALTNNDQASSSHETTIGQDQSERSDGHPDIVAEASQTNDNITNDQNSTEAVQPSDSELAVQDQPTSIIDQVVDRLWRNIPLITPDRISNLEHTEGIIPLADADDKLARFEPFRAGIVSSFAEAATEAAFCSWSNCLTMLEGLLALTDPHMLDPDNRSDRRISEFAKIVFRCASSLHAAAQLHFVMIGESSFVGACDRMQIDGAIVSATLPVFVQELLEIADPLYKEVLREMFERFPSAFKQDDLLRFLLEFPLPSYPWETLIEFIYELDEVGHLMLLSPAEISSRGLLSSTDLFLLNSCAKVLSTFEVTPGKFELPPKIIEQLSQFSDFKSAAFRVAFKSLLVEFAIDAAKQLLWKVFDEIDKKLEGRIEVYIKLKEPRDLPENPTEADTALIAGQVLATLNEVAVQFDALLPALIDQVEKLQSLMNALDIVIAALIDTVGDKRSARNYIKKTISRLRCQKLDIGEQLRAVPLAFAIRQRLLLHAARLFPIHYAPIFSKGRTRFLNSSESYLIDNPAAPA